MTREIIEEKIAKAQSQIDEIKQNRIKYQDALKQMDMNESGWRGFIEGLKSVLSELEEENEEEDEEEMN
jgi:CHASE3 domain sensor protein